MRGGKRNNAGRKVGSKSKSTQEIKDLVQSIVDFPALLIALEKRAKKRSDLAAKLLLEYGFGKPKETLDITSGNEKITSVSVAIVHKNEP